MMSDEESLGPSGSSRRNHRESQVRPWCQAASSMQARTADVSKHNGHAPQASEADDPSEIESELLQEYNRAGRPPQRVRASTKSQHKCSAVIFWTILIRCGVSLVSGRWQTRQNLREGRGIARQGIKSRPRKRQGRGRGRGASAARDGRCVCARECVVLSAWQAGNGACLPACMHACGNTTCQRQ